MSYVIRIATVCLLVGGGYLRFRQWRSAEPVDRTVRDRLLLIGTFLFAAYLLVGVGYDLIAG